MNENHVITQEIYKRSVELLEEKRRLKELLDGVSEPVIAVNSDYKITIFNKAAERMVEEVTENILGQLADKRINLRDASNAAVKFSDFCFKETTPIVTLENITITTPSMREYVVNLKASTIKLSDNKAECLITITDMTTEKLIERQKDEFVSITSHELRTPMTIIKNYLWLLGNKGAALNDSQKTYLLKANRGVERMLSLINDLLDTSRVDQNRLELHPVDVDIAKLLSDVTEDFQVKAVEKKLMLKFENLIPGKPPQKFGQALVGDGTASPIVRADEEKLREIIVNLLGNAFKFTLTGGITVRLEKLSDEAAKKYVKVSVVDTGNGISKEDQLKLFHKFSRLDSSFSTAAIAGGTGLGLYISKSFVEKMNGTIGVESIVGKGSIFWFKFPTGL
ncbi:MAG: PAS domain-containing sensor histidine kinase [candidate division WWE3 bacterium]|nr:PAS domain-containing sensor histidine kinase [candidate division WWE3 bacterium]